MLAVMKCVRDDFMATILVARTKIKIMHFSHFLFIWHVFIQFHTCPESRHANGVHVFFFSSHRSHMLQPGSPISRGVSASSRVGLCRRTCTHTSPWRCLMDHHGPPGSLGSSYVSYVMFSESSHVGLSPAAQNVLLHSRQ